MADKIVAEYTVKVDQALKDLNKLAARVDKVDDERKKVQNGFKDMSKGMAADFKKVGAAIGLAFGVDQLVSFGKEAVKLAGQMQGVERAFRRIGGANSDQLLQGLRNATRGTVSDLQLMQKAVQASNFKIPLENLASLFKFAQARARETGESVEYLTNSIVLGIGRKSPLILDNLGISAVELRERLKGVGVEASSVGDIAKIIGDIAEEELKKMGDQADTTADKLEKINAVMENMKVVAGEALINFGTGLLYLAGQIDTGIDATDGLSQAAKNLSEIYENDVVGAVDKMIQKNQELLANNLRIEELKEKVSYQNSLQAIKVINEEIDKIEERNVFLREYIKELKKIYDASQKQDPVEKEQIKNLAYYNQLIKDLQAEQANANTTRARVRQLEDEINEAIRQRLLLLGKLREVGGETFEGIESIAKIELLQQQQLTDDILADYAHRNGEIEAAIEKRNEIEARLAEERKQQEQETALAITEQSLNSLSSLVSSINQIQQNAFIREQDELRAQLEQGLITREEFEEKSREIRQRQAQADKDAALFQAVIGTSQAVMQALANNPPPLSYALAGIAAALGAAQIAAIATQPLPQFAEGGFVLEHGEIKGRSHKHGGVHIEAEGGEFITSAKHAKQNADILKAINSGQWEKYKMENIIAPAINQVLEGGFENMGASYMLNTNWTDKNLLRAFDRNRQSERDGVFYLGKKIDKLANVKRNRWN